LRSCDWPFFAAVQQESTATVVAALPTSPS